MPGFAARRHLRKTRGSQAHRRPRSVEREDETVSLLQPDAIERAFGNSG
jgi:hypothetical protein